MCKFSMRFKVFSDLNLVRDSYVQKRGIREERSLLSCDRPEQFIGPAGQVFVSLIQLGAISGRAVQGESSAIWRPAG